MLNKPPELWRQRQAMLEADYIGCIRMQERQAKEYLKMCTDQKEEKHQKLFPYLFITFCIAVIALVIAIHNLIYP